MTVKDPRDALIPSVSNNFKPEGINLLERLRQWPRYEQRREERSSEIDRWMDAVSKRTQQDAPRRVLFVHGQLPGETGSGVYLQQIARETALAHWNFLMVGGEVEWCLIDYESLCPGNNNHD